MKMNNIVLLTAFAVLSFNANAGEFDGISAGFNVNSARGETKLVDPAGPFDGYLNHNSTTGTIFGQYGYVASENMLLTVGASYDVNDTKLSSTAKLKNHYAIYLEPGYVIDKSTLLYGKIGYHAAKFHSTDNGSVTTSSMNGIGYGVGIRNKLDNQFFVQAELEQVNYSKKTVNTAQVTPHITSINVGIGYQF